MEQREVDNMLLSMIQKHFPSLPLSDEHTDWGKWLGFARAAYEAGRASPASASVAAPNYRIVDRGFRWDAETRQHIPQLLIEFAPVPANEPNEPNDSKGWKDRDSLAAMLAAAPTPASIRGSEDSERFREGWTHACNALCMEIALWIERCPHCGMPAPKAPATQEDKP